MGQTNIELLLDESHALLHWAKSVRNDVEDEFAVARQFAKKLGGHYSDGKTAFGFWTPELQERNIPSERVFLEVYRPTEKLDLSQTTQTLTFQRYRLNLLVDGAFTWGVVDGLQPGGREKVGDLYQLIYQDRMGNWTPIRDHLAYSLPFGAFAPAELYDMQSMLAQRRDKEHFRKLRLAPDPDGIQRILEPSNILQIHVRYASPEGTIAGLTRIYKTIADKIQQDEPLTPIEENFIVYDAIQLMPIEPIIEYEAGEPFWRIAHVEPFAEEVTVEVHKPDMTNWGYDIVISASSATNPALMETRRPHELLELIETLHNFPNQPIMVMFDIVYGHIDNQALPLLNKEYFAGANMYGQNVNFLNPYVRANLLEMQRRKHNYGIDGVRVDGAQDFKNWDAETDTMWHDDDYLHLMNDVEQDVDGTIYRPWMIFEDGRPWPRDDWELASTYREVTKIMPNVWQWGPLTFAHNTPFLFTFWMQKWWRIREMAQVGRYWITGCANHDTLRRGTQVPLESRINTYLGETLPDIIRNAYDNPSAKLFDYALMPGIPMDFINASMRAPWGFIRNTDDRYGVKVVSEEALWMYWHLNERDYVDETAFTHLKAMGFNNLDGLRRFLRALNHAVQATDYYLDAVAELLRHMQPPLALSNITVPQLKAFARAFMDDVHAYCNIWRVADQLDASRTHFNRQVREFRKEHAWLINNLANEDTLDYLHPADGSAIFYGLRHAPDGDKQILFIANMEGAPRTVQPSTLSIANLVHDGWQVALKTPHLTEQIAFDQPFTLADSQGVVFVRQA